MDVVVTSEPEIEPVSVTEMRRHLRDYDTDDTENDLVQNQIAAARQRAETFLRHRLITQTVELTMTGFPAEIEIPVWPVQSVLSVKYDDKDGAEQTVSAGNYRLVKTRPRRIAPVYGVVWPETGLDYDSVRVSVKVGYGAAPADVPADIRAAILLIAGDLNRFREDSSDLAGLAKIPNAAVDFLRPYVLYG